MNITDHYKLKGHWRFQWLLFPFVSNSDPRRQSSLLKPTTLRLHCPPGLWSGAPCICLCCLLLWKCTQEVFVSKKKLHPTKSEMFSNTFSLSSACIATILHPGQVKERRLLTLFYSTDVQHASKTWLFIVYFIHGLKAKSFFQLSRAELSSWPKVGQ